MARTDWFSGQEGLELHYGGILHLQEAGECVGLELV